MIWLDIPADDCCFYVPLAHPASGATLVPGPVWQFTTTSDVPVHVTTWGRIKSLYASAD